MTYATQTDMVARFGEPELVQLTDRFDAPLGLIDAAVLGQALAQADAEADSYIATRVALPLATVPARLVDVACDLARYHLYTHAVPDHVANRYQAALDWLRMVARGVVSLGIDQPAGTTGAGLVEIVPGQRLFARSERGLR